MPRQRVFTITILHISSCCELFLKAYFFSQLIYKSNPQYL